MLVSSACVPLLGILATGAPQPLDSTRSAVLFVPFRSASALEYAWIGHGVAEALTANVLVARAASVVPFSALNAVLRKRDLMIDAMQDPALAAEIGRALGAGLVVSGSFQAAWPDVELSVRVLDAADARVLGSKQVSGHVEQLIVLTDELAKETFKVAGWPAPRPGALGTKSVYAFREAMIGLEILSLQTFGPRQRAVIPAGTLKRAQLLCESAVAQDKHWPVALGCLAAADALLGTATKDEKLSSRALELAQKAREARGYSGMAALAAHWVHVNRGEMKEALESVKEASERYPGFLAALACEGEHLQMLDRHKEARAIFERYSRQSPDSPYALVKLGKSLARLGEDQQALAVTLRAVERSPKEAHVLVELGSRQIDLRSYDDAERSLKRAIEVDPRDARAYLRLGYLYLVQKQPQKAIAILEKSIAETALEDEWRTKAFAYFDLARAHAETKALDKAFMDLDLALSSGFDERTALEQEAALEPLRRDPRWPALMGRLQRPR
jgi:tetratricopeptide (TPR) repeat protein